jgi:drug/metabolite transporter (DMT)-like permease
MDDAAERFEKRIEEYKAAGYNLKKRDGDTVVMGYNPWWYIIGGILFALGGVILLLYSYIDNGELNIFSLLPTLLLLGVASCSIYIPCYKAIISLTKTGQIEETGTRVLPKK